VTDRPSGGRAPDNDQIKPFHAKEVTTGQEAADVVKAVIEHAAARDAAAKQKAPPKPQPIWMLPLGLTLSVLATFLLVAQPSWVVVNPIAAQSPEDVLASTQRAIYGYAMMIESYRARTGRLPQSLAELGKPVEGLDYEVVGESYTIGAAVGDAYVGFNSSTESPPAWAERVGVSFANLGG
jgi:hypothetical protein